MRPRLRDGLLITLTAGAGAVDAVSYLGLGKVFTANMTGNIVLLGLHIASGASPETLRAGISLIAYILGVLLGSWLAARWARPEGWPTGVSAILACEALAQAGLWAGWLLVSGHPGESLEAILVGISAIAMGLQSSAARTLGVTGVSTTYVTGTLTGLIGGLAEREGSSAERLRRGLVLVALLGGAAVAALLLINARSWAPGLSLVLTLTALAGGLVLQRTTRAQPS